MHSNFDLHYILDHVNEALFEIDAQAAMMISKITNEQTESRKRITDEANDLLAKIRLNPKTWNHKSLQFKIKSSQISPSVGVEVSKTFFEFKCDNIVLNWNHDWNIIGKLRCFENFKLSFEFKMKNHNGGVFLKIGDWFGITKNRRDMGSEDYVFGLQQANGLTKYNEYIDTNIYPFIICLESGTQWYKEFSKLLNLKSLT